MKHSKLCVVFFQITTFLLFSCASLQANDGLKAPMDGAVSSTSEETFGFDPEPMTEEYMKELAQARRNLPTVQYLKEEVAKTLVGQAQVIDMVTSFFVDNLEVRAINEVHTRLSTNEIRYPLKKKQCALFVGPTGVGKTEIMRIISKILNVPFVAVSCGSLTKSGYVGRNVPTVLEDLMAVSNHAAPRAQNGIMLLDEIDKLCEKEGFRHSGTSVGWKEVQKELLTLIEGASYKVDGKIPATVDTSAIIFVAAGAFPELTNVDFVNDPEAKDITSKELVKAGIMPELAGRLNNIMVFNQLTKDDFVKILKTKNAYLYQRLDTLYRLYKIQIKMTPDCLAFIAAHAIREGTGARGLQTMVDKILAPLGHIKSNMDRVRIDAAGNITVDPVAVASSQESLGVVAPSVASLSIAGKKMPKGTSSKSMAAATAATAPTPKKTVLGGDNMIRVQNFTLTRPDAASKLLDAEKTYEESLYIVTLNKAFAEKQLGKLPNSKLEPEPAKPMDPNEL